MRIGGLVHGSTRVAPNQSPLLLQSRVVTTGRGMMESALDDDGPAEAPMRTLTLAITFALVGAALATTVHATSSAPAGMYLHVTNGGRVKTPQKTAVYMVDRGVLRHVHYAAYTRLWDRWGGITLVNEIPATSVGEPIRGTTRLVRIAGERAVWYIDNDRVRRSVPTFYASGIYAPKFSGKKVEAISRESLLAYEEGPELR